MQFPLSFLATSERSDEMWNHLAKGEKSICSNVAKLYCGIASRPARSFWGFPETLPFCFEYKQDSFSFVFAFSPKLYQIKCVCTCFNTLKGPRRILWKGFKMNLYAVHSPSHLDRMSVQLHLRVQDFHHFNPKKNLLAGLWRVRCCPLYLFHHYLLLTCTGLLCKRVSVELAENNYSTYSALLGYCDLPTRRRCRRTCPQQQNSSSGAKPLPVWTQPHRVSPKLHRASHHWVSSHDGSPPGHCFSFLLFFSPFRCCFFLLINSLVRIPTL